MARTGDGGLVRVSSHSIPTGASAASMLAHVRRLSTLGDPNLLPILGARIDGDRLWVYSEHDDGQSLAELLTRTALTAPQSVAIGMAVVAGLEALQRAGFAHGSLDTTTVHVASYGQVRLTDYGMRPLVVGDSASTASTASTWPDPRRDVSAAGRVICAALGIDPERGADGGPSVVERTFPGLAATALTIASGSAGRSAATAAMMLSDGAGRLASRSRVYLSIAELGRLVQAGRPTIEAAIDSVMAPTREPVIPPTPTPMLKPVPIAPPVERPRAKPNPPAAARATSSRVPLTLALRRLAQATVPAATIAAAPPAAATPAKRPENLAAPRPKLEEPAPAPLVQPVIPAPGPRRTARGTQFLPYLLAAVGLLLLVVLVGPMVVRGASHPIARPASALTRPAAPAPAPAARPVDVPPAPAPSQPEPAQPEPAAAAAGTPQGTVFSFFDLVLQRRYEEAAALWSPRMKANYPPFTNINERFAGSTVLTVNQARLTSSSDGVAVVAVDLTEVADGVAHHWLGTWRLVDAGGRWLLDQPDFQPA